MKKGRRLRETSAKAKPAAFPQPPSAPFIKVFEEDKVGFGEGKDFLQKVPPSPPQSSSYGSIASGTRYTQSPGSLAPKLSQLSTSRSYAS